MKKFILLFLMAVAMTTSAYSEKTRIVLHTQQPGASKDLNKEDRHPVNLPITVYHNSDTNILEVWCDNDNIRGEVFVYDESGSEVAYSPYMNVTLQLTSSNSHSIKHIDHEN